MTIWNDKQNFNCNIVVNTVHSTNGGGNAYGAGLGLNLGGGSTLDINAGRNPGSGWSGNAMLSIPFD